MIVEIVIITQHRLQEVIWNSLPSYLCKENNTDTEDIIQYIHTYYTYTEYRKAINKNVPVVLLFLEQGQIARKFFPTCRLLP